MTNDELVAELTATRTTRGLLAAIRTLRRRGYSLPLAILYVLRIRQC